MKTCKNGCETLLLVKNMCRPCYNREYARVNVKRKNAASLAWNAANPEKRKALNAAWSNANPEKRKALNAAYYAANREIARSKQAIWRKDNAAYIFDKRMEKLGIDMCFAKFEDILKAQDYLCPITGKMLLGDKSTHVDHCHTSSEFRGILHSSANKALGLLSDDVNQFKAAIKYLTKGQGRPSISTEV